MGKYNETLDVTVEEQDFERDFQRVDMETIDDSGASPAVVKLLITGNHHTGSRAILERLSDIPAITLSSDVENGLDYGCMKLDDDQVHLYSVRRNLSEQMWESLGDDVLGVIMLIDASAENALDDLQHYLQEFHDIILDTGTTIGLVNAESGTVSLQDCHDMTTKQLGGVALPIFEVEPTSNYDTHILINTLLEMLDC